MARRVKRKKKIIVNSKYFNLLNWKQFCKNLHEMIVYIIIVKGFKFIFSCKYMQYEVFVFLNQLTFFILDAS